MARKRRKRRPDAAKAAQKASTPSPEALPAPPVSLSSEGASAPAHAEGRLDAFWGSEGAEEVPEKVSDESCLSHPSHDLSHVCDDCAVSMCSVCAISFGAVSLCTECFEVRISRRRRGGSWHGWVALAAGLFALGAVVAPFTLAVDPEIARAFPGGKAFFIYSSSFTAGLSVLFGLGAQDYNGFGKRAGLVAVMLGTLAFCAILFMNVVVAFGS
jgi:hypothetical protein